MRVLSAAHADHDAVAGLEEPKVRARARDVREKALFELLRARHGDLRVALDTTRSSSVKSKGFDIFRFGTLAKNWAARSVKAPPVMNTMLSSTPGKCSRS